MAGKSYIKVREWDGLSGAAGPYWQRIKKMYVKTGGTTWTQIRKAYIKVSDSSGPYWRKVFDTTSNGVYWNNDRPRIRLNSYRSAGYVEANPVQYMGPDYSGDSSGWPNESIGAYLWGANASDLNNIISGNGSTISYKYEWLWNTTGNNNDDANVSSYTSPTSDAGDVGSGVFAGQGDHDRFKNASAYLGANGGDYWDKNFITFKVTATNSTGLQTSNVSDSVYIVRQRPSGTIAMIAPDEATPSTTMSASFTYSNSWYNKADLANSFVEWFAVDNLGDTLTTSNRVQVETLSSMVGVSGGSGTSYHTPLLTNKYYYVRLTLNNSSTQQAIIPSWFTPKSAFTISDNKTAKTSAANGAFSLVNPIKTSRYYDSGSGTFKRSVSVNITQSSGADRYEVQVEGQYNGASGAFDYGTAAWNVLQTLNAAPYVYEADRINGILTYTFNATNYLNYRFTARSRNGTSLNGAAYSNNGSSTSYVYVTAPNVAPSAPVISNIASATDVLGSFVQFDMSISSPGSNALTTYEYSINNGSTWQSVTGYSYINDTGGKIYLTGGTSIQLKVRAINLDLETSSASNMLSITVASQPDLPTNVIVKSFAPYSGTIFLTTGNNTQSVQGYLDYDSQNATDSINGYININSNTAGKIDLSGGNSNTRIYTAYLISYSGANKTGNSSAVTSFTTKVLSGNDETTITFGTVGTNSTNPSTQIDASWTPGGASNAYSVKLYNYNTGLVVQDKGIISTTSVSFTDLTPNTTYYVWIKPRYIYASSSVYYEYSGSFVSSNVLTAPAAPSPFTTTSMTKGKPATVGGNRPVYVSWNASTNATRYEVQLEGSSDASSWSVVQSFTASPYYYTTYADITATYWKYYRATVRSSSPGSSYAYSDGGSASSLQYRSATGSAPGTPILGTVTKTHNTASIPFTFPSDTGSNHIDWIQFSTDLVNWTNKYTSPYDITGLSASTSYTYYARSLNYDGFTSGTTSTSFTTNAAPVLYTVIYDANGGSSTPASTSQQTQGGSITLASGAGTKSGYTFGGWNIGGVTYAGGSSYTPTATVTATAVWNVVFTTPTCVAPSLQFQRTSTAIRWYCDYPTPQGSYSYIVGMNWQLSTTASTTGLLNSGTRAYPGDFTYPYSAGGSVWAFRMGSTDGDIAYSASARYGRARVVMMGTNGTTYYGTWSSWI